MKKSFLMLLLVAASIAIVGQSAYAQMGDTNPMVGGAAMFRARDIVDNAVNSQDHTTLVAAVKAAGLVPTLKSKGPFTVFAPTNEAFEKLPAGTVDMLLKPENKATLTKPTRKKGGQAKFKTLRDPYFNYSRKPPICPKKKGGPSP